MPADPNRVKSLFLATAEKTPPERAAFLDQECAGDPELRRRVEELLQAHNEPGDLTSAPEATNDYTAPDAGPKTCIGPYKLLQQIGEGGMGVVYVAEQEEPVRRKVALKIIKPGMDSAQILARFEAERQALALMDHPNIAKVLDAGTTPGADATGLTGHPFFVMELVHGVPINKFCDDNRLTPRERLELFVPVCQAIQHAHQKGIIHRDVKPSNILVTMYDDKPVPKVIDFGVAKAVEQRLTEKTLFTQYGALVGTLEYMSPEQAEMNALGVDTRSDIYSLRVLLYELLTGTTPLEGQRLRAAAPGRDDSPDPGRGAAAAERAAFQLRHPAEDRGGAEDGAGAAVEAGAWRVGLDRDEVPGEGPHAALRDGQRVGEGCRALPARRASRGLPAVDELSVPEVRAEKQDGAADRERVCAASDRGDGGERLVRGRGQPAAQRSGNGSGRRGKGADRSRSRPRRHGESARTGR
jgi:hypothetical protein